MPIAKCDLAEIAAAGNTRAPALLLSAIHPIRKLVIGDYMIELRRRLVVPGTPGLTSVDADGRPLIAAQEDNVRIFGVNPGAVVVISSRRAFDRGEVFSSIYGSIGGGVRDIYYVLIPGIHPHPGEIIASAPYAFFIIHTLPLLSRIIGAKQAAKLRSIDERVDAVGIAWCDANPDAPKMIRFRWQPVGQLFPVGTSVG